MLLGCIADDFTGGTDLAGTLVKAGMRTVQMIGVPATKAIPGIDAVVIALKSRTIQAAEAVAQSLNALHWLREAGCRQFYFKYCSTFDSTASGNIGPVAEALMDALGTDMTIACPAMPANGRTVYKGHLFVGDVPLHESGMRHHPLTPMTDSNLVRVLQQQARRRVALIDHAVVAKGADATAARLAHLRAQGANLAIVDALDEGDLITIGAACADLPLVTGGSGLGTGLASNFSRRGMLPNTTTAEKLPTTGGLRAVVSGSCSTATQAQVAAMAKRHPVFTIDPLRIVRGDDVAAEALAWAEHHLEAGPVLVSATAAPEAVSRIQAQVGTERSGDLVETTLATIACGLVERGVGRLVVAGGETSGAVVRALGVSGLQIGPEIDPGVPWTIALRDGQAGAPLALALKSGNFGTEDFFLKAWDRLA